MTKILITGAYGFVGKNVAAYLKEQSGFELHALDVIHYATALYQRQFTWEYLKSIDWDTVDTVIHLAGKAHDTKNTSDAQSYFDVNYGLTKQIFDLFLQSKAKTFIFFSSVKAAADTVEGDMLLESHKANPQTPYGQSKLQAEEYIQSEMQKLESTGKRVYILRPCMIHGPGNKGNLNLLYRLVRKGIPYPLGAFENKRSFTSIDNLCFVLMRLIEGNVESGIYQIGDDEALSTNELISVISGTLGSRTRIWNINAGLIRSVAKAGDVLHLPLNSERLKKLTENYVVSNAKLKKALEIEKMPVSAQEGLRQTIKSFLALDFICGK
ncbi:MAG: NAD-dependent epimerase/dehydratase family protein [Bacteroidota bacterium]|nr:NAD-dependent epimerase/dehydratase family protein [Bacteroidota bacterium]